MPLKIVVCAKQVVDPETPASAFRIDQDSKRVVPAAGIPPVVNGFDENAVEAALQLKESVGANVIVVSVGSGFVMDVMKKPLSMGADELVLVDDPLVTDLDAFGTAVALAEAIRKVGDFDLVLCGRQASDWDNAMVPLGVAELLGLPCVTLAQKIEARDAEGITVHRALTDGYEVVDARLPALVTVSNELGEPRYPTLRGIMTAGRKSPTVWSASDLGLYESALTPKLTLDDLFIPTSDRQCELIEGEDDDDAGRNLALKLRDARLI